MSHKVRTLATVALLIVLVAGPSAALPLRAQTFSASAQAPSALSGIWDWFSSLITGLWEKEGSIMDPHGTPAPGEAGGTMDPDGLNATGCPTEAGSIMDPDGRPMVCPPVVG